MPFTFAHPAIVLPFRKLSPQYISIEGLMLGCMLPDFEYFIRMQVLSKYSHSLAGLFYFDLLLGLILIGIYYAFIKKMVINHLPQYLYKKFKQYDTQQILSGKYVFILAISILLGAFSHIVWDMFTHPGGFFINRIPILSQSILIGNYHLYFYKLMQHGSTLLGFAYILYVIHTMPNKRIARQTPILRSWFLWFGISLFIVIVRNILSPITLVGTLIVTIISASLLSLFVMGVINNKIRMFV